MKVVATAKGFYVVVRNEGDIFEVPDGFKGGWFVPTEAAGDRGDPDQDPPGKKGKRKPDPEDQPPA